MVFSKREELEGPHCYEVHMFGESIACPDYDDKESMNPKCLRFGVSLVWNVSGRVLKCEACLKARV